MNGKAAHDIRMNRYGSRCQRDGIGKSGSSHIAGKPTLEFDNMGIDEIQHAWVKDQVKDVQISQENLNEQPREVADKTYPDSEESPIHTVREEKSMGQSSHDNAGDKPQGQMEAIQST